MLMELPIHHVSAEGVVLQMPEGQGFGRLTKKTLGNDKLAERMISHFANRDVVHASSLRRRDATGYIQMSVSLSDVCSDVKVLEAHLSKTIQDLYRKSVLCGIGALYTGRVKKRSANGTILSLPNNMSAATVETLGADTESVTVRVVDYEPNSNTVSVIAAGETISRAPRDAAELAHIMSAYRVGGQVSCKVLLAVNDTVVVEVLGAENEGAAESSVIGYILQVSKAQKSQAKRGAVIKAKLTYVPTKSLQGLTPFVTLTLGSMPTMPNIRSIGASSVRVQGDFPWREGGDNNGDDEYDDEAGDSKSRTRRRKLEEAIDAFERDQHKLPKNPEDFKKALLEDPNSSYMWTRYMAHHLELEQVEEARQVAEKALSTIGVRESQELLNVWVAYMNLENLHGTAESLTSVFRRANSHSDETLAVHEKLADIFKATKKHQQLLALCRVMSSKYRMEPLVWERLGKVLIDQNKRDQLKRTIKELGNNGCLRKDQQALVVTHLCIYEFKSGSIEAGRSMFEALVAKLPKKSDIWSAFIDQELALVARKAAEGSAATVRGIFNRVVAIPHPPKVMQQLFTRFLSFEQAYGDASDVERVKGAAKQYVESRIAETAVSA